MKIYHSGKLIKPNFNIFIFIILYSIISIFIILFVNSWIIRILTMPLFFFLLGYPLCLFISNTNSWERFFLSFGISSLLMLITFYFQYFTDFYLGITPSFHQYATEMIIVLWITISILYFKKRELFNSKQINFPNIFINLKSLLKKYRFLIMIIIFAIFLRFAFLNFPDFATDDTIFSALTYPVIDPSKIMGLPSPPFQFLTGHHPPLFHLQANININLLNPFGWIFMEDWMIKFQSAFTGVLSVIFCFGIVKNIYNDERSAYISTLFFATFTFAVITSMVFYQEPLLIIFIGFVFYFAYKERWALTGFFIGLSLLVKFSALILIPTILIYLAIRYLRFDIDKFKLLLKNLTSLALVVLILYLPIVIANIASYCELGYMDTFWSRLLGLPDPMTEAVGEAEIPLGDIGPGIFNYFSYQILGLINIFGILTLIFLVLCVFLSFFDKKQQLYFNLALISFIVIFLLVFTTRMFQIITLSPIIFPLVILSSRITNILKEFKLKKKIQLTYTKRKVIVYGFVAIVIIFSTFYTINTIGFDHSSEIIHDANYQINNPAYYFSNLGYLWIARYGYDDIMDEIKNYSTYTVYIDDDHPRFSYIYYFWVRNYTSLLSDWNYENDSLFVIYKFPNNIWEAFQHTTADDINQAYIEANCSLLLENSNFMIYITN